MSRASLDSISVLRRTRLSQILFGAFALAAVAIAAVGLPKNAPPGANDFTLPELPPFDSGIGNASRGNVDFTGVGMRLSMVANAPKKPVPVAVTPPPADTPRVDPDPTPPPPVADGSVLYLGAMKFGSMQLALVSVGGKQRFARLNDLVEGDQRLTSIERDYIVISGENDARQIDLSPRGSEVVTRFAARTPAMPMNPNIRPGSTILKPGPQRPASSTGTSRVAPSTAASRGIQQPPKITQPQDEFAAFQARKVELIREQLRATGKFQDENELDEAARAEAAYPHPEIDVKAKGGK